jgi:hypothetical protein
MQLGGDVLNRTDNPRYLLRDARIELVFVYHTRLDPLKDDSCISFDDTAVG